MGETVESALKDDYFYFETAEKESALGKLGAEWASTPS